VVAGRCTSTPQVLHDGRIRLREDWRRFDRDGSRGVSYIEEASPKAADPRGGSDERDLGAHRSTTECIGA
jgi:hypothetical protein